MASRREPKRPINWADIAEMLRNQGTKAEICATFAISPETLYGRCLEDNGENYSSWSARHRFRGYTSLRAKQYELAMTGDKTMLVWLGKNWLGQRDRHELSGDPKRPLSVRQLSDADLEAIIRDGKGEYVESGDGDASLADSDSDEE